MGNPSYKGNIDLPYMMRIAVINEIDIEDYLKKVVPSEMPVSFGVNALKMSGLYVQAMHIHSLRIIITVSGAHIDDSVSFSRYTIIHMTVQRLMRRLLLQLEWSLHTMVNL